MTTYIEIRKDKNLTASALFGVAALLIYSGVIVLIIDGFDLSRLWKLACLGGFIYIPLGILARRARLPAALLGAFLYAAYLTWECFLSVKYGPNLMMEDLFFKALIIVLLLMAVISALKCSMTYKAVTMTLAVALIVSLEFLAHAIWLNSLWKREVLIQAICDANQQARQDMQSKRPRLFELHGENYEDLFSGRHKGPFEIWYAEYHPSIYVMRTSEEKWVETYNQSMELWNLSLSNSTPGKLSQNNYR